MVVRSWSAPSLGDQIVSSAVSKHHSLMATGDLFGQINVWDFETGKAERIFFAGERRVNMLQFLDKYPILVSGTSGGQVQVWSMSRAPLAFRFLCLGRFVNGAVRIQSERAMLDAGKAVTCGSACILKISLEHDLRQSDSISVPAEEWDDECSIREANDEVVRFEGESLPSK